MDEAPHNKGNPSVGKTELMAGKAGAEPYSQIGVMFGEAEFAADVTADYVVAFLLEIVAHILAFQSENIEAAVANLPVRQVVGLQFSHKLRMAVTESIMVERRNSS